MLVKNFVGKTYDASQLTSDELLHWQLSQEIKRLNSEGPFGYPEAEFKGFRITLRADKEGPHWGCVDLNTTLVREAQKKLSLKAEAARLKKIN